MPAMEKNGAVAIGASKDAGEEAPVPVQALVPVLTSAVAAGEEAPVPIQAPVPVPVPASAVAAGEEAPAGLGQIPLGWDPYKEVVYIRPENPYNTSIADPWSEKDSSDVHNDEESKDTKTCHVLRSLKSGQYNNFFAGDVYMCPFCPTKRLCATDFNSLVKHAEDVRTCGESVNVHIFIAKHQALGLHLRNLQKVAIEEGRMPPIKPKAPKVKELGSKKWRRHHREEAEALLAEAMRGH